jgi:hypothetical protein
MSPNAILRSVRAAVGQPVVRWLLGFKGVYLAVLPGSLWFWNGFDREKFYAVNARWPREGGPVFASHFGTWDAAHYLLLSEVGYGKGAPSCAFFPLWPLLVRGVAPLLGGSHVLAGLVLANAFSLVAWVLFHRLVARRWGESTANLGLIFLVAFPGALFFQFNYTESLFLLLVMVLWLGLEQRRYRLACATAFLLPITRPVGLFCLLPLLWHLLTKEPPEWIILWLRKLGLEGDREIRQRRERNIEELQVEPVGASRGAGVPPATVVVAQASRLRNGQCAATETVAATIASGTLAPLTQPEAHHLRAWWLVLAPLVGWACYLALMWRWTGNPFEGFKAQTYWGVHSISNLWNVPKIVVAFFTPIEWHTFRGSVLDRCVFMLLLYCLPVIWKLDKGFFIWAWVLGVMPAMSGTFTSFTRFASCAFPMVNG